MRPVRRSTLLAILFALPSALGAQANETMCTLTPIADSTSALRDSSRGEPAVGPARGADSVRRAASDRPSIVLYASASAREVRFAAQPRIAVRLCGAVTDSVHVIERRNLPARVQPGVTYRDVFIAVEIIGHLNADCLAQRIGVAGGSASGGDCASLGIRDSSAATPPRRPPR